MYGFQGLMGCLCNLHPVAGREQLNRLPLLSVCYLISRLHPQLNRRHKECSLHTTMDFINLCTVHTISLINYQQKAFRRDHLGLWDHKWHTHAHTFMCCVMLTKTEEAQKILFICTINKSREVKWCVYTRRVSVVLFLLGKEVRCTSLTG